MSDRLYLSRGYWNAPPLWAGETVVILGGGPSLALHTTRLQAGPFAAIDGGVVRTLAINDAYLLAPSADLLYFCDLRWHQGTMARPPLRETFMAFPGLVVTLDNLCLAKADPRIRSIANMGWDEACGNVGLFDRPWGVFHGRNGGYQAIHLAVNLGASRILLLGYDMKPSPAGECNWHRNHETPPSPAVYAQAMLPSYPFLAAACARRGVSVVNCTPDSALTAFERGSLSDFVI